MKIVARKRLVERAFAADLSKLSGTSRQECSGRRAGTCDAHLGDAQPVAIRDRQGGQERDQHPQREFAALAQMARRREQVRVPVTSFAEPNPGGKVENTPLPNAWFALSEDKPLAFFAGSGRRGVACAGCVTASTTSNSTVS